MVVAVGEEEAVTEAVTVREAQSVLVAVGSGGGVRDSGGGGGGGSGSSVGNGGSGSGGGRGGSGSDGLMVVAVETMMAAQRWLVKWRNDGPA